MYSSAHCAAVINNVVYRAKSTLTAIMVSMVSYSGKVITWEDAINGTQKLVPENPGF